MVEFSEEAGAKKFKIIIEILLISSMWKTNQI